MPDIGVLDTHLHYETRGDGQPVVFLHGNPTSSHLWRNVLPRMPGSVRALALDLVGMGRSGKPDIAYSFADQARYLDAWIERMGLSEVVLVGHDWGGALALDWAARHPHRVRGIAFLETIVRPMSWQDLPESARPVFTMLRTPGAGEQAVLEENLFIERALAANIARLGERDHAVYRDPYPTPASRRPLLQWPRAMPIDGQPADVVARVEAYDAWLAASVDVPKLMPVFHDGPGLMGPAVEAWVRDHAARVEIVDCGVAGHHAPEDQPAAIAAALSAWIGRHGLDAEPAGAVTAP
ncbi:haloalkane dehalogenase [Actinocatenispora sera]|uniref:Haloalkane dehalogenase n=1 Tax=Actinocatenispora sera TaxID=390989 RepID=A0A810L9X8_9ACTN|nr:haloalkane dehalogenase [Actinocatenispora sera]BCJ32370.1 haloalkane dehalogenase [Actinocatenispora sera]